MDTRAVLNLTFLDTTSAIEHEPSIRCSDVATPVQMSIVSNNRLLRDGFVTLLNPYINLCMIGSYCAEEQLESSVTHPPNHIVLIDANIGSPSVISWTRFWRTLAPPACVIVMGLTDDPARILACVEAGASGYTLEESTSAEIAETIQQVQKGLVPCSQRVAAHMFARLASLSAAQSSSLLGSSLLTPRELEVLRLVAADYSNKQIADALVIEMRTVKHHIHHILEKLKLHHRWDAARLARDNGWISSRE